MSAITPCGGLDHKALVARIASTMDADGVAHPPHEPRAGRCRFCGSKLRYDYSATACVEGQVRRVEWSEGQEIGDKVVVNHAAPLHFGLTTLVHLKGERAYRESGLRRAFAHAPTVVLAPNGACEALTDEVFRQASAIARKRGEAIKRAVSIKASARELAQRDAARAAARKMKGSLVQQTEAEATASHSPLPDDGSF